MGHGPQATGRGCASPVLEGGTPCFSGATKRGNGNSARELPLLLPTPWCVTPAASVLVLASMGVYMNAYEYPASSLCSTTRHILPPGGPATQIGPRAPPGPLPRPPKGRTRRAAPFLQTLPTRRRGAMGFGIHMGSVEINPPFRPQNAKQQTAFFRQTRRCVCQGRFALPSAVGQPSASVCTTSPPHAVHAAMQEIHHSTHPSSLT